MFVQVKEQKQQIRQIPFRQKHHKVHGWSCGLPKFWIWFISFQKFTDGPYGLHFVMHLVPNFFQKYKDGPCGLHFATHLVANLDMLKPLDLLVGDEMRYKV
ncbi:hypothetical protein Hanom_Chr09g00770961 [Helianthus anomalus]